VVPFFGLFLRTYKYFRCLKLLIHLDTIARLWKKLDGGKVECTACARRCRIPDGSRGFCYVRQNVGGRLHLANYGRLEAMQVDPIEKKPFNQFMPGSYVFGIGTSSCNWGCMFCQNHNISKDREMKGVDVSPEEAVALAIENNAQGIAYTYNEPTIFMEYALDVAKIAHRKGLYNVFVTNGYMTSEAVESMKGLIDAAVINFKGNAEQKFSNKYEVVASADQIKEALLSLKKAGVHLEITDLVIPAVGDSLKACDELTRWIKDNLGRNTPVHFTRFQPDYKMLDSVETPYPMLKAHYDVAKKNGLDYVYIGNVPGNPYESTYCPGCGSAVIERTGFYITRSGLDKGNKCKNCGHKIDISGSLPKILRYEGIKSIY